MRESGSWAALTVVLLLGATGVLIWQMKQFRASLKEIEERHSAQIDSVIAGFNETRDSFLAFIKETRNGGAPK